MVVGLLAHRGRQLAHALVRGPQRRVLGHRALELEARGGVELAVEVGVQRFVVSHLCTRSRGAGAAGLNASISRRSRSVSLSGLSR